MEHIGTEAPGLSESKKAEGRGVGGQALVAASVQVRVPSRGRGPTALRLNLTQSSCRAPLCPLWGRERRGEGPSDVPWLAWSGMRRVRRAATGGSSSAGTGGVGRLARGAGG